MLCLKEVSNPYIGYRRGPCQNAAPTPGQARQDTALPSFRREPEPTVPPPTHRQNDSRPAISPAALAIWRSEDIEHQF